MRQTTIILLLLLPLLTSAQYKTKYKYRETPQKGELIALAGLAMVAVTATGLMHNERVNTNLSRAIGAVGGGLIYAGVVIDLNGQGSRLKYKHAGNKRRVRVRF